LRKNEKSKYIFETGNYQTSYDKCSTHWNDWNGSSTANNPLSAEYTNLRNCFVDQTGVGACQFIYKKTIWGKCLEGASEYSTGGCFSIA